MKILLGVDESPHSTAAIDFLKRLPWPKDTQVTLVSAVRPPLAAYSEVYVPGSTLSEELTQQEIRHHEALAARAAEQLQRAGFETRVRVVSGDPREVLISEARTLGADVIVVGSHGRSGLKKLLLGSVASHIVTHAPCSAIVVKLPAAH